MKTRLLIIVVIPVAVFLIGAIVYPYINKTTFDNNYSHDIKTALDNREDLKDVVYASTTCSTYWRSELFEMWENETYDYQNDPIFQECLEMQQAKNQCLNDGHIWNQNDTCDIDVVDVDILPGSANPKQQENLFPKTIHVVIGINNTIRWNNLDTTPHTFSPNRESKGFPNTIGILRPNESQEFTFEIPGVYDYHGTPGPWITGTVIVSDKMFDGPGNRHPAFLGFDIPEVCTDDMIKHLDKYSSMFDRDVPYSLEWISMDESINVDDFDSCVKELLEKNPRNVERDRIIIEGQMADQICSITGGHCPSYYIGNPQEDGSVMVGMTFSDGTKEVFYVFLINNDTLSYEVRENEK